MKKLLLLLISIFFLTGCASTQPGRNTPLDPVETAPDAPASPENESEKILRDFDEYLKKSPNPWDARASMDHWMGEDTKETTDSLLTRYLQYLEQYISTALRLDGEAFLKLDPFFEADGQKIAADKVTPDALKTLYEFYRDAGYQFLRIEGAVEPAVDYTRFLSYNGLLSEEMKAYLAFKALNSSSRWAYDGELAITEMALADRILQGEHFLQIYKDSVHEPSVLLDFENYLYSFFGGLPSTPVAADGKMKTSYVDAYAYFLSESPGSRVGTVLKVYYDTLEKNGFAAPYEANDSQDVQRFHLETEKRIQEVMAAYE